MKLLVENPSSDQSQPARRRKTRLDTLSPEFADTFTKSLSTESTLQVKSSRKERNKAWYRKYGMFTMGIMSGFRFSSRDKDCTRKRKIFIIAIFD